MTAHERVNLCQAIRDHEFVGGLVGRARKRQQEIGADFGRALVQQLEEGMLGIGARLAPDHGSCPCGDRLAVASRALAEALHLELLEVGRKPSEPLAVRQHGMALATQPVAVPVREQSKQHGQVVAPGSTPEVLIHRVRAREHRFEMRGADRKLERKAYGRPERVASADPVPHRESRVAADAEFVHCRVIRGHGGKVPRYGGLAEFRGEPGAHTPRIRRASPAS